ncbi:MAG: DUF4251 domain-containing protein [Mangrovibacterium sp.]
MKRKFVILLSLLMSVSLVQAQKTTRKEREAIKKENTKELLASQHFTFEATSAQPMSGRQINLTSDYELTLHGDTIEAYLPYFGRAYTAPTSQNEGGIKFKELAKSKTETFNEKKSMYNYEIEVDANGDNYTLVLRVGSTGYGYLTVNSNSRQPISFSGELKFD